MRKTQARKSAFSLVKTVNESAGGMTARSNEIENSTCFSEQK
jgi:hypothetical protein